MSRSRAGGAIRQTGTPTKLSRSSASSPTSQLDLSPSELFRNLEEQGFPRWVHGALNFIVLTTTPEAGHFNKAKTQLLIDAAMDFIFMYVVDSKRREQSSIQTLSVVNELRSYFAHSDKVKDAPTRNAVFMTLFHNAEPKKVAMLSQLLSLSISLKVGPVLDSTAILLMQMGSASDVARRVIRQQIKDFVFMYPGPGRPVMRDMKKVSPLFAGYVIGALGPLYSGSVKAEDALPEPWEFGDEIPPTVLMRILNDWVRGEPRVPVLPMITSLASVLPAGCIQMAAASPLASMFRWSIISPLLIRSGHDSESWRQYAEWDYHCRDCLEFAWSKLRTDEALTSKEILHLISCLANCFQRYEGWITEESKEVALLRLATLVQLCLARGYFSSSKDDLLAGIATLPRHSILDMVKPG